MIKKIFIHLNAYFLGFIKLFYKNKDTSVDIKIKKVNKKKIITEDKKIYLRLFNCYKLMKSNEKNYPKIIKPSTLWQKHISIDYKFLLNSAKDNNIDNFAFFLNNFGSWDNYLGIEHNTLLRRYSKNFILRNFLKNEIFLKHLNIWKDFGYKNQDISKISTPEFGNQLGAYLNGHFVTIGSFFNQIISKMLCHQIGYSKRPIICDLGGGYGKLGFFLTKDLNNYCFVDFDLPEVLILAAYYLVKANPEKKFLLYGEKEFSKNDLNDYDFIFMPPTEIKKMQDNSVDLFVNKNSLGEMKKETANYYINEINRCSKNFFHMNHNRIRNKFENGEESLVSSEYPVDNKKFDLVFDYPDLSHFIYTGTYDENNDIFMKLYKSKQHLFI